MVGGDSGVVDGVADAVAVVVVVVVVVVVGGGSGVVDRLLLVCFG